MRTRNNNYNCKKRNLVRIFFSIFILCLFLGFQNSKVSANFSDPWSTFYGGDFQGSGRGTAGGPGISQEKWPPAGGGSYWGMEAAVIGSNGKMYSAGWDKIWVINSNGVNEGGFYSEDLGHQPSDLTIDSSRNNLYFHSGTSTDSALYAKDINTGLTKWSIQGKYDGVQGLYGAIRLGSNGILYANRKLIPNYPDYSVIYYEIMAINPDNGSVIWQYNYDIHLLALGLNDLIYGASQEGTDLYILNSNGTLYKKYYAGSGESVGSISVDDNGIAYLILEKANENDNEIQAINPDGSLKWKRNIPKAAIYNYPWNSSKAISHDNSTIYVSSDIWSSNKVTALNTSDGSIKWEVSLRDKTGITELWICSFLIDTKGILYVGLGVWGNHRVLALKPEDGSIIWLYIGDLDQCYSSTCLSMDSEGTIIANSNFNIRAIGPGTPANQSLVASFDVTPSSGYTSTTFSFTDTSSDPDSDPLTYSWNFGDGQTSTVKNPTHLYSTTGTKTVTLTVSDEKGGSDTITGNVSVNAPPAGSAEASATVYRLTDPNAEIVVEQISENEWKAGYSGLAIRVGDRLDMNNIVKDVTGTVLTTGVDYDWDWENTETGESGSININSGVLENWAIQRSGIYEVSVTASTSVGGVPKTFIKRISIRVPKIQQLVPQN